MEPRQRQDDLDGSFPFEADSASTDTPAASAFQKAFDDNCAMPDATLLPGKTLLISSEAFE